MMLFCLTSIALVFAIVPALWFYANLGAYSPPPEPLPGTRSLPVSVLIPARNEQDAIGAAVSAALASREVEFEVIVLDDHSEDATAAIVAEIARQDPRVRVIPAPELPDGWCGKQHACWRLAQEAQNPLLVFIDADVRLSPCAVARMAEFLSRSGADLASGIPHQQTVGLVEKMVIPLVHFILLGFLPLDVMRRTTQPRFAAGCGQLFITTRAAYDRSGGHAAIRATLHDGIKLPKAYRKAGLRTDLFDATDLAECRMYQSAGSLWNGLAKNAGEALGAPALIVPMTLVLLGGQVFPFLVLGSGITSIPTTISGLTIAMAGIAVAAAYYPRLTAAGRFRQSILGAILHPLGISLLVGIQWYALLRNQLGRPRSWKGRAYPASPVLVQAHGETP
jgi:hypothetical protein